MMHASSHSLLLKVVSLIATIFVCSEALGQDTSSQEKRKAALEREIAILNRQIGENAKKSQTALASLTLLRKKLSTRRELLSASELEIANLNNRIKARQDSLNVMQKRLDTMSFYYRKLVRCAYRNRDSKVWYMHILASDNLSQAVRRFGYLKNLSSEMNSKARNIRKAQIEIEEEKAKLEEMKAKAIDLKNKRQSDLQTLQSEEADSKKLVNTLQRDKKQYQSQLASKKKQVDALNKEIQRIIQNAIGGTGSKTADASGKKTGRKDEIDYALASSFVANKGKLPWPADGPVIESYGQHAHPVYKTVSMPFNYGVTMALNPGTPVKAVFDGVVRQIIVQPGFNQCILVQHGNYFTFYCKLGAVSVKTGDKVITGQTLGSVDTIAGETQLHFQLWEGRTPQNPELWLK